MCFRGFRPWSVGSINLKRGIDKMVEEHGREAQFMTVRNQKSQG